MESVIFDQAMDGLPAELEAFKDLFGPSFIRAIKMTLSDCASRLLQIDNTYKPALDDIGKEYDQGMKTYGEVVDVDPKAAEQLQNEELRRLKNLLDSANLAKNAEKQQVEKSCQLKKQDLLRNRMYAVLSVFRHIYEANPDSLQQITGQLQTFINQLTNGLEECRNVVAKFGADEAISICDDDAVIEAIEFIKAVLLTLPTQVERGFPDLPIDSEGDDKPFVVDDGSATDVYVTDLPAILMPGPVIIDDLPEDDDDILSGSGAVELPTTGSSSTGGATEITSSTSSPSTDDATVTPEIHFTDDTSIDTGSDATVGIVDDADEGTDYATYESKDTTAPATAQPVAVEGVKEILEPEQDRTQSDEDDKDDEDNEKQLLPLYIALLVCISLLVVVMVIMIIMVIVLKRKIAGRTEDHLSEEDKVSLMKEGYVNPTYQFFDKTSTSQ